MDYPEHLTRWSPDLKRSSPDMVIEELMNAIQLRIASGMIERTEDVESSKWRGQFSGYATTSDPDHDSWVIENGSYTAGMAGYMRNPVGLFNHNPDHIIFQTLGFDERESGLHIHGELDLEDDFARAKAGQVKRGLLRGQSIGFVPLDEPKVLDGRLRFKRIQILEISLTGVPANPHALLDRKAADRIERWTGKAPAGPTRFSFAKDEPIKIEFEDEIRLKRIVGEMIDQRLTKLASSELRNRELRAALDTIMGTM